MSERLCAKPKENFVVFMLGARINRWWKPWVAIRIAMEMSAMQKELKKGDYGCFHIHNWGGRMSNSVQYWRDFDALEAYAQGSTHMKAWQKYANNGDIAIWHENYEISRYEGVYLGMPDEIMLGKAIGTVPAKGAMKTARKRIEASVK